MRTKEQIVAELLKGEKLSAEDAAILLRKEIEYIPNSFVPYQPYISPCNPYTPPWTVTVTT
jgi:hypothetical protein